jgi:hypothetical protein
MNLLHQGPGMMGFQPILVVSMFLSILIPIGLGIFAIYVTVCVHNIKKSSQDSAHELREIRRLLSEHNRQE